LKPSDFIVPKFLQTLDIDLHNPHGRRAPLSEQNHRETITIALSYQRTVHFPPPHSTRITIALSYQRTVQFAPPPHNTRTHTTTNALLKNQHHGNTGCTHFGKLHRNGNVPVLVWWINILGPNLVVIQS
jgi:hypothetical protein